MAQHGRNLLATLNSELIPLKHIRGKCSVYHRERIPGGDEEAYRQQPDCFLFHQVFILPAHVPIDLQLELVT